jgi:hypothetical protein
MTRRVRFTIHGLSLGDRRLEGCVWEFVGLLVPCSEARDSPWPALFYLPDVYPGMIIQLQRLKLFSPSTRVYGEIHWQGDREPQMSIHGFDHAHGVKDIMRVWQWLQASRRRIARGRPLGTAYFQDADEFRSALVRTIAALRERGRQPTQEAVAQFFSMNQQLPSTNDRQLRAWLRAYGLDWKNLLRHRPTRPPSNDMA